MAQILNQFNQAPIKGMTDLRFNANIISCVVDSTSAGSLAPATPVKIVSTIGGVPHVVECAANSDDLFGFLTYSIKDQTYSAGDAVEVAFGRGDVMYMEASAAFDQWTPLMIVVSGSKVVTASGTGIVIGRALDEAAGSGSLVRVLIDLPGQSSAEESFAQMPLQADTTAADLAALKVDFNLLLGKLKTAKFMASV